MDLFVIIAIVAIMLFVIVIFATLYVQQSGYLADIRAQLNAIDKPSKVSQAGEALRRQRLEVIDPLFMLEANLVQQRPDQLTDQEIQLVFDTRGQVMRISDELRKLNDWMGAPYDLEWSDYFERLPFIRALYLKSSFGSEQELAAPQPDRTAEPAAPIANN